jgi:HEXXH motif-containing protein
VPSEPMAAPSIAEAPFQWRPGRDHWFEHIARLGAAWTPSTLPKSDADICRQSIIAAASKNEQWLVHPSLIAMTRPHASPSVRICQDIQLLLWAAAHSPSVPTRVTVTEGIDIWTPDGGRHLPAGVHDLGAMIKALDRAELSLDVLSLSAVNPVANNARKSTTEEIRNGIRRFARAQQVLQKVFPVCHAWVLRSTRVVVPISFDDERTLSHSSLQLPGVVFLSVKDELQTLEAVVHEAAHQHLFLAQGSQPLVVAEHRDQRYRSPLRPDPRPLDAVLFAYHAITYMSAFYLEAARHKIAPAPRLSTALGLLKIQAADAVDTLTTNRECLSPLGAELFDSTREIASHQWMAETG